MSLMTDYNPHFVKKVYCRDCKWYPVWWWNRRDIWHWEIRCYPIRSKARKIIQYGWLGREVIKKETHYGRDGEFCDDTNEHNDCSDYKRKWYKFWVK